MNNDSSKKSVLIWNLPIRLFHWLLVASFLGAWITTDNRFLNIHAYLGYFVGGLVLFRVFWGIFGGPNARFRDFSYSYADVKKFLQGMLAMRPTHYSGHNPAGSWAIFGMLIFLVVIIVSGVMSLGGDEGQGLLANWTGVKFGSLVADIHNGLATLMAWLVVVHILGVVIESYLHKENLTKSMITGLKDADSSTMSARPAHFTALLLIAATVAAFSYLIQHYDDRNVLNPYIPFVKPAVADNPTWRTECGDCHMAYSPVLLPARSWNKLLDTQDNHFEEDLSLEPDTIKEIRQFLTAHAAEKNLDQEAAYKINRSIPADQTPLQITKTPYWVDKHDGIRASVWKQANVKTKGNCSSCHFDADKGTFQDAAMHIPKPVAVKQKKPAQ